ncbi:hypothetical protein MMC13_005950 [Lambiella insularis]|nr:hypothetical protein [Lambiella insularis]
MGRPSRRLSGVRGRRASTTLPNATAPNARPSPQDEDNSSATAMEIGARRETAWLSKSHQQRERSTARANFDESTSNSNTSISSPIYSPLHGWQTQAVDPIARIPNALDVETPPNANPNQNNCLCDHSMPVLTWSWTSPGTPGPSADPINLENPGQSTLPGGPTSLGPAVSHFTGPAMNAPNAANYDHVEGRNITVDAPDRSQAFDHFETFESWQSEQTRMTSAQNCEGDCIQQLSGLNMTLNKQLLHFSSNPGPPPLSALTCTNINDSNSSNSSHIGDILHSSQGFLKILHSFPSTSRVSDCMPTSATFLPDQFEHDRGDPQRRDDNPYQSGRTNNSESSSGFSVQDYNSLDSSGNGSSASSQFRPTTTDSLTASTLLLKPDTTMVLLILTCYVHIIRIYSTIFSSIHRSLLTTLSGRGPSLSALPGLELGGFPLQSGNLQVKILIAVVVHLLNHIEKTLGLPLEYRVSRGDGRRKGMLSDSCSIELFKVVIKQEERASGKSIREQIRSIKHLLKDSLAS